MSSEDRPAKRMRMDPPNSASRKSSKGKSRYRAQKAQQATWSQGSPTLRPSGIHDDDVGIFVSCSKGQENKSLRELAVLLGEFFDSGSNSNHPEPTEEDVAPVAESELDIEADISAELAALRPQSVNVTGSAQNLSLVTLDIPCVSFVRFPPQTTIDPVEVVRKLCLTAASEDTSSPQSRYIMRLTPISMMRKTLNDGLEKLCQQILPRYFLIDSETNSSNTEPTQTPCKFAIRPTIRNNNKLDRDQVIRTIADKIGELGQGKHTVDLKGYDKLVLVDVYRNMVGMSVVGNDYEKLKRFNLSEIYHSRFGKDDSDSQNGGG